MNELAVNSSVAALSYCYNFNMTIKTAGKIKRLVSSNQEIDFELSEDETLAKLSLRKGEEKNLEKDIVIKFSHDKLFEPVGFTQINEFGEQTFLVNFLPIIKPPKIKSEYIAKF